MTGDSILMAALIGGIGGGVGAAIGGFIDRLVRGPLPAGKVRLGTIAGVAIALGVTNVPEVRQAIADRISPPTQLELRARHLLALPQMQERVRGKSGAEVQKITQELSAAGLLKLDDASLVLRVQLLDRALTKADAALCAGFATQKLDGGFGRLIGLLTPDDQVRIQDLGMSAAEAELGAGPVNVPPPPSPEQVGDALQDAARLVPELDRIRFFGNLGDMARLDGAEACWTARTLYSAVSRAASPTQATLARAIVMP